MSLREWLIAIGALVLIVIVIDGIRRMRRASKDSLTISSGMGADDIAGTPLDDDFNPELPNGGARPVSRDTLEQRGYVTKAPAASREAGGTQRRSRSEQRRPETVAAPAIDDSQDPDGVDEHRSPDEVEAVSPASVREVRGPVIGRESSTQQRAAEPQPEAEVEPRLEETFSAERDEPFDHPGVGDDPDFDEAAGLQADPRQPEVAAEPAVRNRWASSLKEMGRKLVAEAQPEPPTVTTEVEEDTARRQPSAARAPDQPLAGANRPAAEEVIVINVLAREQGDFSGKALKNLFEACGLDHGDLDIYHRHETADTTSPVQFSVANAVEPGTFTPARMADMSTPGISFFMSLPGPSNSLQAFDFMLETAQCVVRNLGGELKDERRSVMTAQTIEHCRQRIREYERKRHSRR